MRLAMMPNVLSNVCMLALSNAYEVMMETETPEPLYPFLYACVKLYAAWIVAGLYGGVGLRPVGGE